MNTNQTTGDEPRGKLRDELAVIIQPFKTVMSKPPFSFGQLIVIALTTLPVASATEIWAWIRSRFDYYDSEYDTIFNLPRRDVRPCPLLFKEFLQYELPINELGTSGRSGLGFMERLTDIRWELMSILAARCFLQDMLVNVPSKQPHQSFRFLDLASEIRCQIYKLVLCFPRSGVRMVPVRKGRLASVHAQVASRDPENQDLDQHWHLIHNLGGGLRSSSLGRHLALLSVNRQVSREASGIFYSANTFVCVDLNDLNNLIDHISPERRKCLRSIVFAYGPYDYWSRTLPAKIWKPEAKATIRPFEKMKEISALRELSLVTMDRYWFPDGDDAHNFSHSLNPVHLPGIDILTSMTGLTSVRLIGPCPVIAAFWEEAVAKSGADTKIVQLPDGGKLAFRGRTWWV